MPSPFPGMDPYLESPARWGPFHFLLISAMNDILQPVLRPRGYVASPGERLWVTQPGRSQYPDVSISKPSRRRAQSGTTTTMEADTPVRIHSVEVEMREPFLEILDVDGGRLVTGIEVISPWNKAAGRGRRLYRKKQRETLQGGANLVEVDLLRRGHHILAFSADQLALLSDWDYLVSVARASTPEDFEVYPIPMEHSLPKVAVPLSSSDKDVVLDFQAVMDLAYDRGAFEDRIDYTQPPHGRMSREQLAWCDQVLRAKGLRSP